MSLKIMCSVGDIKVYIEDEDQSYTPEVVADLIKRATDGVHALNAGLLDDPTKGAVDDE